MHRVANWALVALFVLILALPVTANLWGLDGADPAGENRAGAPFPPLPLSWEALRHFPSDGSRWFEDHFGFRSRLVQWYGETRLFLLGTSPSASVVKGKDGWFFYADDGGLEDVVRETVLSPAAVANWREAIVRASVWCRARNIAFTFTIAPDKHVIYPEHFRAGVNQLHSTSRSTQVFDAVSDVGGVIDVQPALEAAKKGERIYHRTDSHWNDRGAFIAYDQLINNVREQVPRVPPAWARSDFNAIERDVKGLDLARMMGLQHVLREHDLVLAPKRARRAVVVEPNGATATAQVGRVVTEIPGSDLPRALIFRDSFAAALAPFLSEHFSRAVYLWQNDFDAAVVLEERADVVIQEIAGRHLYVFEPTPSWIPNP